MRRGWQDRDLKRLRLFIEKSGIELARRPYSRREGYAAEYDSDINRLTLFIRDQKTRNKTEMILTILHELGHHEDKEKFANDKFADKALIKLNEGYKDNDPKCLPKSYRKKILQIEKSGLKHWMKFKNTLDLEIPVEKIEKQQKIDLFHYQVLYEEGLYPKRKRVREYIRSLKT